MRLIQELFRNTSESLFLSTNRRAFIKNVNIIIPSTEICLRIFHISHKFSDFLFLFFLESWKPKFRHFRRIVLPKTKIYVTDSANQQYGDYPYVYKTTDCGEPRDYIRFTRKFLVKNHSSFGKSKSFMVHLFGHLLYGLHDEFGYAFDSSKTYYIQQNKIQQIR